MATQAELAQGYNDFISAMTSGNFGKAANVAASLGFSPAETEAFIEANAPGLGFDPGIDIPSDVVASYFDAPPVSYGPPSPAVSPVVSNPVSLTPAGIAALAPSANVSSPANVFSPADYGPPSPPPAAPPPAPPAVDPVDQQAGGLLNQYYAAIDAGDIRTARNLLSQAQNIYGPETLTNVAQDMLSRLNQSMTQAKTTGDFTGAAKLVEAAGEIYGGDALQNIADYLNTDLQLLDANKGVRFTPQNLVQFIQQGKGDAGADAGAGAGAPTGEKKINAGMDDPLKDPGTDFVQGVVTDEAGNILSGPPDKVMPGIPRFTRQTQSDLTFAPLRRGLAQLRTETYSPGLTSGQRALVGSGFTPAQLRDATQDLLEESAAAGKTPEQTQADFAYLMDIGGVSPAEMSNVLGQSNKVIQTSYDLARPEGVFATPTPAPAPQPFALPEDFTLQTGAYGAPTPTFFARNATAAGNTAAGPAGVDQPTYAQLLDNVQRLSAQVQPLLGTNQDFYNSGGDGEGIEGDPNSSGFSFSGFGFGDESGSVGPAGGGPSGDGPGDESGGSVSGTGSPGDDGDAGGEKEGGLIRMAEGGGPPKMAELSAKEAGSTFDISKYIDDEGRLVGGYSKPIS
jgi:hypothetical protein